ncbi:subtilisin-like protease SBT3.9 isoform X2 [Macadamia integrifolia]|uniref:subtilisin-like protease SBT3.9 isoform X2 n=1 Tax=Macadamia integrifolia TaxID=60698 RepID=UPI001C528A47|nr:subtilisin-like protease SBT3.9 isoform X2 [Macadamia integrifolia]
MIHKLLLLLFTSWMIQLTPVAFSESTASTPMENIVYMERTPGSQEMIVLGHIHTLASVLGSEEAARKAIIYCYKNTINGFSALLTKVQVEELSKQPGVLKILPAPMYHLPQEVDVSTP